MLFDVVQEARVQPEALVSSRIDPVKGEVDEQKTWFEAVGTFHRKTWETPTVWARFDPQLVWNEICRRTQAMDWEVDGECRLRQGG